MKMKPERLSRTVVYENPWVSLYVDKVQLPGGRVLDEHHVLHFGHEAVAALVENDRRQLLLVNVYRYVTDTIEWEVPAGVLEDGEAVLDAARREVLEESGYETTDHELVYTYHPMYGIADEVFHIARCQATKKLGDFDRNEVRAFRWASREEIRQMIGDGLIRGGFSLTALLLYMTLSDEGDDHG
jgi:ADP-ribose pyrophosphatase